MTTVRILRRVGQSFLALVLPALVASGATYLPMSDADLVAGAPIVAHARVIGSSVEAETVDGEDRPFTVITLSLIESIKGSPGETFAVRLPGGRLGDTVWWLGGTPVFSPGEEVILMLAPHPAHPGQFRLTELGLSKFVVVTDDAGRRFAVRPAFSDAEDLLASKRTASPDAIAGARDAESFLAFLRSAARGDATAAVAYAAPLRAAAKWVNLGSREPGGGCQDGSGNDIPCLFRWFFGNQQPHSNNAVITISGTQTNLFNDEPKCGTDANCDVQNAADAWHGVPSTDVELSTTGSPANVSVKLDATTSQDNGTAWNTALGCPPAGVIGLGGPDHVSGGPVSYRGDPNFYAVATATVSMRKVTCTNPMYSAATFRSAVLHEVGHVLGLGHPDSNGATPPVAVESIHSTTSSSDWSSAVMRSVISSDKPDTPQTDDIQGIQYYYGTAAVGAVPASDFRIVTSPAIASSPVSFADASTGGATGWNWNFGDPTSGVNNTSTLRNPSHTYGVAGHYTVTLVAGNLSGSSPATAKAVTVAAGSPGVCVVDPRTLCLNGGRFKTTIHWQKTDGTSGDGTGIPLTSDSGYFWFFSDTNIEAVVKVLNGCAVNGHYWVFAAGLTNVMATLTVVDEHTGIQKPYVNPQGTAFAPIQDTAAFGTCP